MLIRLLQLVTPVAHASVDTFVKKLNAYIINPVIIFLFILAVAYFLYGVFEYLRDSSSGEGREKGRDHMIWGIIGLSIMAGVFLIMRIILGTIGIDDSEINVETGEVNIGNTVNGNNQQNQVQIGG